MKAAVKTDDWLEVRDDVARPRPKSNEVLVKVHAATLNRADLFLAEGRAHGAHGGAGTLLGLEFAGEIVERGADVQGYGVGDRVMCSGIGGLAEYAVCDWRRIFPAPAGLDMAEASGLTVALRTAFVSLLDLGGLTPGQSVLVLGASSGVGLMCLQMAKELGAGLVIGTSTTEARRARLAEFGADLALDGRAPDWAAQVTDATGGTGVDLAIDFLAGPYFDDLMRATRIGGAVVNVGRMAGERGEVDFDLHSLRRIRYLGQTFRTRSAEEMGEIGARLRTRFWSALDAGRLRLPVDRRLPLDRAAEAFDLMRANGHFGKIAVTPA